MKVGIIGAMEEEIRLLLDAMDRDSDYLIGKFLFYTGRIQGQEVVLVQSGIGKVNAAVTASLLVDSFGVDQVINTGVAGAVDPSLVPGQVVIANQVGFHDVDVTEFGYKLGQMAGMPEVYYPDTELCRTLQDIIRSLDIEPVLGLVLSGDEFVAGAGRAQEIRQDFPLARACEMESGAIAQVCYLLDVPFGIIRAISDSADQDAQVDFDSFVEETAQLSALITLRYLARLDQAK